MMSEEIHRFPDEKLVKLKNDLTPILHSSHFSIEPIDSGASVRKYFLLNFHKESEHIPKHLILMQIPTDRLDIADDYVQISEYLSRNHIPHPNIYHIHRDQGFLFIHPTNGVRLDIFVKDHPKFIEKIYHQLYSLPVLFSPISFF